MSKSQLDGTGLLVAVLAAALALTLLSGPFVWLGSICGLVLVFVLLGFDREGYRTLFESLAFSAVFALCVTVAAAVLLSFAAVSQGQATPFNGRLSTHWLPLFWVAITILFWPIDRARMTGRVPQTIMPAGSPFSLSALSTPPPPAPPLHTPVAEPVPPPPVMPRPETPAPATASARPTFTQPSFSSPPPEPAWTEHPAPPPSPALQNTWTQPPPPAPAPEPVSMPAPPPPAIANPTPAPSGKETMIYVTLVGEGLNVLRAVRAEHLGRDYYKIVEPTPDGETWQFVQGQVVRAKKKNLSSGKAMVATEEAPRSR